MELVRKVERKGFVRVTCFWLVVMFGGECFFKSLGVGLVLYIVSVLVVVFSVLLVIFRKVGVVVWLIGCVFEIELIGEKEVVKVSVVVLGFLDGMLFGKDLGMVVYL